MVQAALRDVVARCIHGVDLNPMAVELAKVSLWLEGLEPGRPLAFLDANLRPGNALLGTTPALLAAGVPEAALKPLAGDDRKVAALLARRNRNERIGADDLFTDAGIPVGNTDLASAIGAIRDTPAGSLADVHVARRRYRELAESPARRQAQMVADAWCTAFVQEKSAETVASAVTDAVLRRLAADPVGAPNGTVELVRAAARRYRFFHWHLEFPHIFRVPADGPAGTDTGWGGFACVVGNPPWDAVQMSEKEYFAERDPDIATAPNAAARKKLIARLPDTNPNLFRSFSDEARRLEGDNHLVRESGRFPLTARGKINTYSIFAETMRAIVSDAGRAGVITPTGLATDATTAPFFADTVATKRLAAFYDFENEAKIFAGVHNQFRFGLTSITGRGAGVREVSFAFYTRFVADVSTRRFLLAPEEVLLLNPNTGTLPLFRSRLDADVTLGVYRRLPVLVRDGAEGSNPWLLTFRQGLFNMASDSGAFRTQSDMESLGATFDGWAWTRNEDRWLPLYEAKLLGHYDHRFSTYAGATQEQLNKGTLPRLSESQHSDPDAEALVRYWVADRDVDKALAGRWERDWLFGWRDITNPSNERTMVPCVLPRSAVGNKFPLALPLQPSHAPLLQSVWSSIAFDYVARQKLSGTGMTYFILKQVACPPPAVFEEVPPWAGTQLRDVVLPRVLELTYTSYRIAPYARDLGDNGAPFRWNPERRTAIRAELDAAMMHVYGLGRDEVEHVLDSFPVVRKYEERDHGEFRTKRLVLDCYDAMATAAATGTAWRTALDPPPGAGCRHENRGGS